MTAEITDNNASVAGWLFYDGECHLCCESARRVERILTRRRIELRPLQSADAPQRLGLSDRAVLREMRLLLADGRNLGGANALVEIARRIWWAWPLWLLSRAPGARPVLHAIYRVIAVNRHCIGGVCKIPRRRAWRNWLPLLLPVSAIAVRDMLPAWVFMGLMAFAIYAGFKGLTFRDPRGGAERSERMSLVSFHPFQPLLHAWSRLRLKRQASLIRAARKKRKPTRRDRPCRRHTAFLVLP